MVSRITSPGGIGRLASLCLAWVLALGLLTQQATAASAPQEIVRSFYGVLLSNMKEGRMLGETGRYARLAPVGDRTFDIPFMPRLAIGPYWGTLTPAQQQRVMAAFAHYVTATYADQFDSYSGQQLQVTGERPYGTQTVVETRIIKSN